MAQSVVRPVTPQESVGLAQRAGATDLVEALRRLVAEQELPGGEHRVQPGQLGRAVAGEVDDRCREPGEPVVDEGHVGRGPFLVVAGDAPRVERRVRGLPAVLVAQHGHRRGQPASRPAIGDVAVVDAEEGVTVKDEEAIAEQRGRLADRPERPVEPRRVVAVGDLDALAIRPDRFLDHLTAVADAQHDTRHAVVGEEAQLVDEERLAGDLDQALGPVTGRLPQAGSPPSREDAHRRHRLPRSAPRVVAIGDQRRPSRIGTR